MGVKRNYPDEKYKEVYRKIIANNLDIEKSILGDFSCMSAEALRRTKERLPDMHNIRPAFFHDTDRIIHCKAYSRYIDKTQVFSRVKNDHITRRVLHVQMVSKIARTIGRFLRANEDLIEAIALAHDLGHAPFGHVGESIIAQIVEGKGEGSFVHNAQSVRLLDRIENSGQGLNLTLQVLDGILGHNGEFWEQKIEYDPSKLTWDNFDNNVAKCFKESRIFKPEKTIFHRKKDMN
jgi:dGTPase